jgi:hypothetical protein
MPVKRSQRPTGLAGLAVARAEGRTHNQRGEDRQVLTAEEARLFVNRKAYVVDLLNLSGGGAMIRTNLPLKLWKRVHLELGDGDSVECAVRWIKGDRVGLEFAHETQVAGDVATRDAMLLDTINRSFPEVAEEPAEDYASEGEVSTVPDSQRRTELRHPLIWSGEIHYDYESTRVRLRNISEHGALVDCTKPIPEGAELLLDLGGAGQHFAFVSWARGDQLGLKFQQNFDIACLAHSQPEVAPQSWSRPEYLNAEQDTNSPWAEPWERLSLPELRDTLEGFLKR